VVRVTERIHRELDRLAQALALAWTREGEALRLAGELPIAVTVNETRVRVALDGWWQEFPQSGRADPTTTRSSTRRST
jgi:hypothetical protein